MTLENFNQADNSFKYNLNSILREGTKVPTRAKWEDGSTAYALKRFGVIESYFPGEEFPALTLRPIAFKNCIDELLWIWQKRSNNINDLNSHIWDEWADKDGSIGKAYGWQLKHKKVSVTNEDGSKSKLNQVDYILHELKYNKYSRRIIANMYNIGDLDEMNLYPCAYSITLNVTKNEKDQDVLNMVLNQRSNDFIVANNWNLVQYSILLLMFAQVSDMIPGELLYVIADAHVYDRHIDIANELLNRPIIHKAPKLWIDPSIKNFYDFTVDSFKLIDYEHHPQIKNIPVAV